MRLIVLTSSDLGFASLCLPTLIERGNVVIAKVVLNEGIVPNRAKQLRRGLGKIAKIGPFGALNGIRMRVWYRDLSRYLHIDPLQDICDRYGIQFETVPWINCERTVAVLSAANADLGLSLGNGYIGSKVFAVPRLGMLNVHHAILPDYQNAQSILWEIYNGHSMTGYAIHRIDKGIDTGAIVYEERFPIELRPTLGDTVTFNYARLYSRSVLGLSNIFDDPEGLLGRCKPQGAGRKYTTPSFMQYVRMLRNHASLFTVGQASHWQ